MTDSESKPQAAADTAERIAFLGLGIMGSRMARNLRAAWHDVVVWNRTRSRADELGEPIADTPRAAAQGAGVVITMVVDSPQVEDILFGETDPRYHGEVRRALLEGEATHRRPTRASARPAGSRPSSRAARPSSPSGSTPDARDTGSAPPRSTCQYLN